MTFGQNLWKIVNFSTHLTTVTTIINAIDFRYNRITDKNVVYLQNTYNFVQFLDVFSGLVKACVFGFIISLMGCYHGYNAKGGAQGVGLSTTYSVVSSSILILLTNYILTSFFFDL